MSPEELGFSTSKTSTLPQVTTQADNQAQLATLTHAQKEADFHDSTVHACQFDLGMAEKLDSAESIINLAWEAWFASRPSLAARSVNKLLPGLEKIAYSSYLPNYTLRAKELVTRAHGVLGNICLDSLQHDTALFHYMQAHRFAEEIHDVDLATTYLCLVGEVLRRQNDQYGALSHMENARDQATDVSNTTRGYILQLLAYTYGDTGQEAAFERTISEATDLLAFSGEGRDASQKEFIPFEIYEIRGKINRDLGKPLNAIPYLELAEKSLITADSVTPRWHALLEISRAQVYCDAGDIATGIELACKGFLKAYQCHSPHQMNRVRKLLRKLEKGPFRNHPRVQDLKNLLYETYMCIDNEDADKNSLRLDRVMDNGTMKFHRVSSKENIFMADQAAGVLVTVDIVIPRLLSSGSGWEVILIQRNKQPYQGMWALPGGHLNRDDSSLEAAAQREAREETGLDIPLHLFKQVQTFEDFEDSRGKYVCLLYVLSEPLSPEASIEAGDDACCVQWHSVENLQALPDLAFNHIRLLRMALHQLFTSYYHDALRMQEIDACQCEIETSLGLRCSNTAYWRYNGIAVCPRDIQLAVKRSKTC
jgi:8-oxo-dGTP diphosphatase